MENKTQKLIDTVVANWDEIKNKYQAFDVIGAGYDKKQDTVIGELYWNNPNLIFVLVTSNEEGYDGSQTQIGIDKGGKLRWEYQSHCSCNGYEDSHEHGTDFKPEVKTYELESVPLDWENKIQENIEKIIV